MSKPEIQETLLGTSISRRTGLRMSLLALGTVAVAPLLAACGDDDDDEPTAVPTTAPADGDDDEEEATEAPEGDADEDEDEDTGDDEPTTAPDEGDIDRSAVGGDLIWGRSGDSDTLDPQYTNASISWQVFSHIFDTLVSRNMDLEFEPNVCESYEVSEDGLTYTFVIRDGMEFHDGTPVNAEAVAFTFNRVIDPATGGPTASWVDSIDEAVLVDDTTVQFNLNRAFSPLLGNISSAYFGILSPTAVEELGDDFGRQPIGSGPFKFEEWVPGERITLVRNDNYTNRRSFNTNKGAPYLDRIIFRNIPEEQTQIAAFETGEINFLAMPAQQMNRFQDDSNYELHIPQQSTSIAFIEFSIVDNDGELEFMEPFDDLRLRQAVGHAIDADTIIDRILQGLAVRNFGLMPTGVYGFTEDINEFGYEYDPEKSADLLEEAGWTLNSSGVREKDGNPLEVVFWTWNATTQERIAQVIQAQLEEIGITARLETMEVATVLARLPDNESHLDLMGWGWSESDLLYMMTDGDGQIGLYQQYNPEYAQHVSDARLTSVLEERAEHYFEATKLVLADAAAIPLWSGVSVWATRAQVKGFHLGPQGYATFHDAYQEL